MCFLSEFSSTTKKRRGKMKKAIMNFLRDEEGVTAIEYGLIAALIAVAIIGTVTLVGTSLQGTFGEVSTALDAAPATP
jgi:pilus assembly protein Flp/PilA